MTTSRSLRRRRLAQELTVSAWVRFDERDLRGWTSCIIAQDDGNDEDQSRRVFQLSVFRGHIVWHRMIGARDPICARRVRFGWWTHVAGVYAQGMNRLYVAGELCDVVKHKLWTHPTQPLHIGRKGTAEPHFYFKGAIGDVRMYDRALSDAEIGESFREDGWSKSGEEELPHDPLSGRWGQQGVVFLHLQYDGESTVTGRIMGGQPHNMAPIVKGTFDRATRAISLAGTATDLATGAVQDYLINGALGEPDLTVVAHFGDFEGNFILTRRGAAPRFTRRSLRSNFGALWFDLSR